jgi:hypothetical protein
MISFEKPPESAIAVWLAACRAQMRGDWADACTLWFQLARMSDGAMDKKVFGDLGAEAAHRQATSL